MQSYTTVVSIAAVFFEKAAIIKLLCKVILPGMYNCNLETIRRTKKTNERKNNEKK